MIQNKKEYLSGWGHAPVAECLSFRPEKQRELKALVSRLGAPAIARGMGRSYGDASLAAAGTLLTSRLDHMLEFDAATGQLRAQAGVTLEDVMRTFIPKGWLPPVIPGTRHVSLGGMLACNVHGKNQYKAGDFAEHVAGARVLLASGESMHCSPQENSDLFWATAGGYGMTGVIEELTLRLKPITSTSLKTTACRVDSIEDMLAAFVQHRKSADYMVGWIDHMGQEKEIGRGVFEAASHLAADEGGMPLSQFTLPEAKISVPFFLPSFLLNRYTMAIYNSRRFGDYGFDPETEKVDFAGFFHPLDAIGNWNRLYGRRGFFQYQCLLPETPDVAKHLRALLSAIHQRNLFSFLAVIKYHRDGSGPLAFSKQGYSLALDFPNTARVRALLDEIDRFVADRGGRVYLAKDARLKAEMFYKMYGNPARDWREFVQRLDPQSHFDSLMAQRLLWKNNHA